MMYQGPALIIHHKGKDYRIPASRTPQKVQLPPEAETDLCGTGGFTADPKQQPQPPELKPDKPDTKKKSSEVKP